MAAPLMAAAGAKIGGTMAIQAGGSMLNQIIAGIQNRKMMARQYKYDRKASKEQFDYETEAWNRTNLYNNPTQVMERYKAAGLNPNLIYGGGMGNTAGSAPAQEAATRQAPSVPLLKMPTDVLGQYQDFRQREAEYSNVRKQYEIMEEQRKKLAVENQFLTDTLASRKEIPAYQQLLLGRKWFEMQDTYGLRKEGMAVSNERDMAMVGKILADMDATQKDTARKQGLYPYQLSIAESKATSDKEKLGWLEQTFNVQKAKLEYQKMVNDWYEDMRWLDVTKAVSTPIMKILGRFAGKGKPKPNGKIDRDWQQFKPLW